MQMKQYNLYNTKLASQQNILCEDKTPFNA